MTKPIFMITKLRMRGKSSKVLHLELKGIDFEAYILTHFVKTTYPGMISVHQHQA